MGAGKHEEFSVKHNRIAKYAKALAHPARVAILQFLIKKMNVYAARWCRSCLFRKALYHSI